MSGSDWQQDGGWNTPPNHPPPPYTPTVAPSYPFPAQGTPPPVYYNPQQMLHPQVYAPTMEQLAQSFATNLNLSNAYYPHPPNVVQYLPLQQPDQSTEDEANGDGEDDPEQEEEDTDNGDGEENGDGDDEVDDADDGNSKPSPSIPKKYSKPKHGSPKYGSPKYGSSKKGHPHGHTKHGNPKQGNPKQGYPKGGHNQKQGTPKPKHSNPKESEKPTCKYLLEGWCHDYKHWTAPDAHYGHPKSIIRCPTLEFKHGGKFVGCQDVRCTYQHPNPANLLHQEHWKKYTGDKTFIEKKKFQCFYLCPVQNMVREMCVEFRNTGECPNADCPKQHIGSIQPASGGGYDIKKPRYWTAADSTTKETIEVPIPIDSPVGKWLNDAMNNSVVITGTGKGANAKGIEPTGYKIVSIVRLENYERWKQYCFYKHELRNKFTGRKKDLKTFHSSKHLGAKPVLCSKLLDPTVNEYYLFHGTSWDVIKIIKSCGFDDRVASVNGLFGGGIYFAENSSKSNIYIPCPTCGGNAVFSAIDCKCSRGDLKFGIFMCRVLLGDAHIANKYDSKKYREGSDPAHPVRRPPPIKEGSNILFDSVIGESKVNGGDQLVCREFVVYDRTVIYPEYLITFQRL